MYSRGKGVGTLTLFHTTKICDFSYPISNLDAVLKKRNEKRLTQLQTPVPEKEKKKTYSISDLSDWKLSRFWP